MGPIFVPGQERYRVKLLMVENNKQVEFITTADPIPNSGRVWLELRTADAADRTYVNTAQIHTISVEKLPDDD